MITSCKLHVRIRSRALRNLQSVGFCNFERGLLFQIGDIKLTAERMATRLQSRCTAASSSSSISSSLSSGLRYFSSKSSSESAPAGKSLKPKVYPSSHDSKQSEEDKTGKSSHKPLLISSSNTTRMRNDKIRQSQQQGEDDKQQNDAMFATSIGALANVGLATSKGMIGYAVNSTGLMADAANSAGDLLIDAVVFYTIKEARKKATPENPWGRGKIEPLGALTIGGVLLATGGGIGYAAVFVMWEMICSWQHPELVLDAKDAAAALAEEGGISYMQMAALAVSTVSVVTKEALYHYTLRVGNGANSDSVKANAWQHRSDACVSLAVLVGLLASMNGFPILDPMAGILVAGVIVKQGTSTAWESLQDLSDAPASPEETQLLRESCLRVPGILSVVNLHARRSGPFLYVECTVGVPGNISASAAHRLAELARNEMMTRSPSPPIEAPAGGSFPFNAPPVINHVMSQRRVANAVVHVDPLGSTGLGERSPSWARDHDSVAKAVTESVLSLDSHITGVSEVQVYYRDDGRLVLKVDVVMSPDLTIRAAHKLAILARNKIESDLPGVATVDVDLELGEGDDEPNNAFFDMRGEGFYKDEHRVVGTGTVSGLVADKARKIGDSSDSKQ